MKIDTPAYRAMSVGDRRLTELADMLSNLSPAAFDMSNWFSTYDASGEADADLTPHDIKTAEHAKLFTKSRSSGSVYLKGGLEPQVLKDCGFAACAVGWAGTHRPFIAAGFRMLAERDDWDDELTVYPSYDGQIGSYAVTAFFELNPNTSAEWMYLFGPKSYSRKPSPAVVAKRIRSFVKRRMAGFDPISPQWRTHHTPCRIADDSFMWCE